MARLIDADNLKRDISINGSEIALVDIRGGEIAISSESNRLWASPTLYANAPTVVESKVFMCPCCGTHYIARDPGFVPNCHNCGAVMKIINNKENVNDNLA